MQERALHRGRSSRVARFSRQTVTRILEARERRHHPEPSGDHAQAELSKHPHTPPCV
jgi:hypothetical protein